VQNGPPEDIIEAGNKIVAEYLKQLKRSPKPESGQLDRNIKVIEGFEHDYKNTTLTEENI
jgi:hypothetical protein